MHGRADAASATRPLLGRADPSEPRMDAGCEAVIVGDPAQQQAQLFALAFAERRAEGVVMRSRDAPDLGHRPLAFVRQPQGIETSILGVVPPLEDPALLQLVDVRDEAARQHPQDGREGLLTDARVRRDGPKNPGMRRDEADHGKALGKASRRMSPELRKQKCVRARMPGTAGWVGWGPHSSTIATTYGVRQE